jgi:putative acyl-CoA dehydrogenase
VEAQARVAVDSLALLAAAAALAQSAPEVAVLFARTRLQHGHGALYGTSEMSAEEARRMIDRALPAA